MQVRILPGVRYSYTGRISLVREAVCKTAGAWVRIPGVPLRSVTQDEGEPEYPACFLNRSRVTG